MAHQVFILSGSNAMLRQLPPIFGEVETRQIESANDALWEVRTAPPVAIVVSNDDLPDMSGVEMAEILPNFEAQTRVILLAHDVPDVQAKAASLQHVCAVLDIGATPDDLHAAIQRAIQDAADQPIEFAPPPPPPAPEPEPEPEPEPAPAVVSAEPAPPAAAPEPEDEPRQRKDFVPARVRLPSRAERIAARARELAASEPRAPEVPTPVAAPEAVMPPLHRSASTMVVTADNLQTIRTIMSQLLQELGPQCILLTDHAGMVLVEVGSTDRLPTIILLPLLSTSFSTAGEITRQLKESETTTVYIHEGVNYDLYSFNISQRFLLVLVFNKKVATSKIGAVWVNTKRAIRDLEGALLS